MPEGQVVDQAGDVGNGQVVIRLRVVRLDVEAVLRRGRVAFERSRSVVERVLPREGVQQGQPADKALLVANLQRIVVGEELIESFGDVAGPVGILPLDVGGSSVERTPGWR